MKPDLLSDLKRAYEHLGVAENIINSVSKPLAQTRALGGSGPIYHRAMTEPCSLVPGARSDTSRKDDTAPLTRKHQGLSPAGQVLPWAKIVSQICLLLQ